MKNPTKKQPLLPQLTVKQAAAQFGIAYSVIDRWINEGLIPLTSDPGASNPRARRFFRIDFLRFLCNPKAKKHQLHPLEVPVNEIEVCDGMQLRLKPNEATINDYAEALDRHDDFPQIVLARVEGTLINIDGVHRLEAFNRRDKATISAFIIEPCSRAEELYLGLAANKKHGLPLSAADKTNACMRFYAMPEFAALSYEGMGKIVGCVRMTACRAYSKLHGVGRRGEVKKNDPLRREKRIFGEIRNRVRGLAKQAPPELAAEMETTITRWEIQLLQGTKFTNTGSL